jgi:3-deoxy-7-phosphoheptulonate synthase
MSRAEYASISEGLADALDFTRTIGLDSGREAQSYERGGGHGVLKEVDLYTRSVPPEFQFIVRLLSNKQI